MRTYTATQAKTHFGTLLDQVQREPVRVLRRGRVMGVLVSAQDHEAMRNFYANRLQEALAQSAADIAAQGLTEVEIRRLLDDER